MAAVTALEAVVPTALLRTKVWPIAIPDQCCKNVVVKLVKCETR